jgi:hypothetical protein
MKRALDIAIEGIGLWAPGLPDHAAFRARLGGAPAQDGAGRPAAGVLAAGERRRAPESVLLACEVAAQACAAAERPPAGLACVFASMQGDSAIMDYMCTTLADDPRELSPTRFHNSVHNAAAGYWTIATGCHAASTAVSAGRDSFTAGLFEAAVQVLAEGAPVLFVACDIGARGALAEVVPNHVSFGIALVLDEATRTDDARSRLRLRHGAAAATTPTVPAGFATLARDNVIAAPALALLAMLADAGPRHLALASGAESHLDIEVFA